MGEQPHMIQAKSVLITHLAITKVNGLDPKARLLPRVSTDSQPCPGDINSLQAILQVGTP